MYQKRYKDLGNYLRFRSVDNLIVEIKEVIEKYKIKNVLFYDDTFTLNEKRIREFSKKYPKEIGLPFKCVTRPDISKTMLKLLKRAGCETICMAIECRNEKIRKKISIEI